MQTVELEELSSAPPSHKPQRILVVDDEPRIRLALRSCLEDGGYEVLEAFDGLDALDHIITNAPDLMIIDLAMPTMGGIKTLEHLHGLHGQLKPRVIVLTAWASFPSAMQTIALGASLFIPKPVLPDQLREAVEKVLQEPAEVDHGVPIDWSESLREEEE